LVSLLLKSKKKLLSSAVPSGLNVVELDEVKDGEAIHTAVKKIVGKTSVPQVFVGGKSIGGCDDTYALHDKGKLQPLIKEASKK